MSVLSDLSGEIGNSGPLERANQPLDIAQDGLLMFARFPVAGKTKTRLIPALGAGGAADLQRQMTTYLLGQFCRMYQEGLIKQSYSFSPEPKFLSKIDFQLHFTGGTAAQMERWLTSMPFDFSPMPGLITQCEGSLGARLIHAFTTGFTGGLRRILVVGSDCPALDGAKILQALALLASHDVVLGPALDGGYYLIGLGQLQSCLFENIAWSTDRVLAQTMAIARQNNLSVALLDPLPDIDRPEDLPLWYALQEKSQASSSSPQTAL